MYVSRCQLTSYPGSLLYAVERERREESLGTRLSRCEPTLYPGRLRGHGCEQTTKHFFRNKNATEFVWKHFCWTNRKTYIGSTMLPRQFFPRYLNNRETYIGSISFLQQCSRRYLNKQENIYAKHNVSETMFPEVPE